LKPYKIKYFHQGLAKIILGVSEEDSGRGVTSFVKNWKQFC